ncbi:recombinase family protein [Sphingomonas sp. Leaf17]|uniref:recombinase family protein n=1 Tax=Sphingomonas sp. Leaf17 TaxID=1735683 RepID=UPI0009EAA4EB|nr:recombinase family protein [Sphingomonas sp. Leaf17]
MRNLCTFVGRQAGRAVDRDAVDDVPTQIVREGWQEAACFTDVTKSAATLHCPGMGALIAAIEAGGIDIVYTDAMDRLSRSQVDIPMVFDRLRFRDVALATRKEGRIRG